jgi:hypothetical protein
VKSSKSRVKVSHQPLGTGDLPCQRREIHSSVDDISLHFLCEDEKDWLICLVYTSGEKDEGRYR